MSLNKVMLIGNVGQDPEVRYLDNSQAKVARMRLATTERYTDRSGETRENTEWHTITCWRKLADTVERYVKKGTMIYVEGKLTTREWTDQQGQKRYSTEVVADNIQLLSKRQDSPAAQGGYQQSGAYQQPSYNQGVTATTPAGPGGYQAPYQPGSQPQTQYQPAAQQPQAPAADFNQDGDDDLPF